MLQGHVPQGQPPAHVTAQAWMLDPANAPFGLVATNGVDLVLD